MARPQQDLRALGFDVEDRRTLFVLLSSCKSLPLPEMHGALHHSPTVHHVVLVVAFFSPVALVAAIAVVELH